MFWKSYSDEGNRRYMLRSGIWEESKNSKSCLRAKRRAGQLADAQTIPAHRLTTSFRSVRYSNRFLQSHISRLSPSTESVLQPSAPLPAHSLTEVLLPKWAENAVMARLESYRLRKSFRSRLLSFSAIYSLTSGLEKPENSPISRKILRGWRMARGAFGRGLVKLKVPDTDVRAGGALV